MGLGWVGWDLCVGLLYEHRFAVLITRNMEFGVPAKKSVIHGGKYEIGPEQKYREVR